MSRGYDGPEIDDFRDFGSGWGRDLAKIRGTMHRIYKIGVLHERVSKNPVLHVKTRSKSDYKVIIITPAQTACDPSFTTLAPALHVGAYMCCYSAPRFRNAVAPLGRRDVGGRADTDLQALGKG